MEPITSTSRVQQAFRREFLKRFDEKGSPEYRKHPTENRNWVPRDVYDEMRDRRFMTWSKDKFSKFKSEDGDTMHISIDEIAALAQIVRIPLEEVLLGERSVFDLTRQSDAMWVRLKSTLERIHFDVMETVDRGEEYLRTLAQLRKLKRIKNESTELDAPDDFDEWWAMWELVTERHKIPEAEDRSKEDFIESFAYSYPNARLAAIRSSMSHEKPSPKKRDQQRRRLNKLLKDDEWNY
jgi:hypothetical protein